MRVLLFVVTACVCALAPALSAADDNPFLGRWELNASKSKFTPGPPPQHETVVFEVDGNKIKRTVSGMDSSGKPLMDGGSKGASLAWDGQEHALNMPTDPTMMSAAVKRLDDHTNHVIVKQRGKVVETIHSVVSKDGKTMTNTIHGTDENGRKIDIVEVLDKQ